MDFRFLLILPESRQSAVRPFMPNRIDRFATRSGGSLGSVRCRNALLNDVKRSGSRHPGVAPANAPRIERERKFPRT
jgi:hypothetical protein